MSEKPRLQLLWVSVSCLCHHGILSTLCRVFWAGPDDPCGSLPTLCASVKHYARLAYPEHLWGNAGNSGHSHIAELWTKHAEKKYSWQAQPRCIKCSKLSSLPCMSQWCQARRHPACSTTAHCCPHRLGLMAQVLLHLPGTPVVLYNYLNQGDALCHQKQVFFISERGSSPVKGCLYHFLSLKKVKNLHLYCKRGTLSSSEN